MTRLQGFDCSSWQHPDGSEIDWQGAYEDGYRFVLVKATQGTDYVNPWLRRDYEDALAEGFLVGAYHFAEPASDPVAQADHFIGTLMGYQLDLGAWLDLEPVGLPIHQVGAFYSAFCDKAWETRPDLGLCTYEALWGELRTQFVTIRRAWIADYSQPPEPRPFLWQSSGGETVPWCKAPVDVDVLESVRGINLPSAPKPRPSEQPATVSSAVVHEPDPPSEVESPAEEASDPVGAAAAG